MNNKRLFAKGKRGVVFLERKFCRKLIVKEKNPDAGIDTLKNEAEFLKILNKHNIGPKFHSFNGKELRMEFIDGERILDFIGKNNKNSLLGAIPGLKAQGICAPRLKANFWNSKFRPEDRGIHHPPKISPEVEVSYKKEKIKKVLLDVLDQMFVMDSLGINKFEMTSPKKHVIVRRGRPVLIDFERCRRSEKPKNVTQFVHFMTSRKMKEPLEEKGIALDRERLIMLAAKYKKEMTKEHFEMIKAEV
ncbi:MAG: hypothetical protein V1659_00910 [Candidatus Woesearchaeota archaeon]